MKFSFLIIQFTQWVKSIGLYLATSLVAFISPVTEIIAGVGLLVVTDMVTGIIAARKSKKEIQSRKMYRTVGKFLVYGLFVMIAQWIQTSFMPEWPATKGVAALIAAIELKSLDENAKVIFGVSFFDKIINLISKARKDENNK